MASTVGSTSIDPKEQSNNGVDRPARLSRVCFSLNESFHPYGYIFLKTHFFSMESERCPLENFLSALDFLLIKCHLRSGGFA